MLPTSSGSSVTWPRVPLGEEGCPFVLKLFFTINPIKDGIEVL